MDTFDDEAYYARRAQQQLDMATAATEPSIKVIHLDLASLYATKRELAARARTDRRSDEAQPAGSMRSVPATGVRPQA